MVPANGEGCDGVVFVYHFGKLLMHWFSFSFVSFTFIWKNHRISIEIAFHSSKITF